MDRCGVCVQDGEGGDGARQRGGGCSGDMLVRVIGTGERHVLEEDA